MRDIRTDIPVPVQRNYAAEFRAVLSRLRIGDSIQVSAAEAKHAANFSQELNISTLVRPYADGLRLWRTK